VAPSAAEQPWPDEEVLAAHARAQFGLPAIRCISALPGGWSARSYRLDVTGGSAFVLKVYDRSPDGRQWLAASAERLPLLPRLRQAGFPWLPAPIATPAGSFVEPFGDFDLLLSEYVPGDHPPADSAAWPESLVRHLAERVAALHSLVGSELSATLPREDYRLVFRAPLLAALERLRSVGPADRPGVIGLRDLLLSREAELLRLLRRTEQLADGARGRGAALVLCHADLHQQNLILTTEGELYLLDWEGLRLAPAEQDLFFWADGVHGEALLGHYRRARSGACLNADTFAYYYHYRNLEDLEAWVSRIVNLDRGEEADRRDLDAIQEYCLRWWNDLAGAAERVRRRLEASTKPND